VASPVLGPEGNREFLMELEVPAGWVGGPARDTDPTPAARSVALPDHWPSRIADVIRG
jgi:hypothetical protein